MHAQPGSAKTHGCTILDQSRRVSALAGLLASVALHLSPGPAAAQVIVTPLALSGSAAPAGGNYSGFNGGGYVALNASGQVAFHGQLTGGSSTLGIFAGAPGSVQAVALQGSASPVGGNYVGFSLPVLNDAGQMAFSAGLTGGS